MWKTAQAGLSLPSGGLWTSLSGVSISEIGILLLFVHVTDEYNSAILDVGSIAIAYLGLILLGLSVSVTGVALLLRANVG